MKLPREMWAQHGPVKVIEKQEVYGRDGSRLNGCYIPDERAIYIDAGMTGFLQKEILEHEWLHAVMDDAGGEHVLSEAQQEWVCRVVGKCLVSRRGT